MATRKKMPLLDLTITERLPIEVLRQEQRQSCDEIMHRAGLRWKNNTQRNLRTLCAMGVVDAEADANGEPRYSLLAGVRA
ncbi:MAG: hypothetical protein ACRD3F_13465 [Acidobacteriaceae bacterium]